MSRLRRLLHLQGTTGSRARRVGASMSTEEGPGVATFGGLRVRYDDADVFFTEAKSIFVNRIYAFKAKREDPRILDAGSHIGMSILFFKQMYPAARIVGFEPDPEVFGILRENLTSNGATDVELVNAALARTEQPRTFVRGRDDGRLVQTATREGMTVQCTTLSSFLTEETDFLKMNIEGEELSVLTEARGKLGLVREMVIEYHGMPEAPQTLHRILEILDGEGFRYMVHSFDPEITAATFPPFSISSSIPFFSLIYARASME